MRNLDLALIGNGRIGALVAEDGTIVWGCFPRFDGDPKFCALVNGAHDARRTGSGRSNWSTACGPSKRT